MHKYVYLDLETTGLANYDQITEAAWALDNGTERHFFVEHDRLPNPWVMQETDYLTRIFPAKKHSIVEVFDQLRFDCKNVDLSTNSSTYLVGANPSFDDRFLRQAFASVGLYVMPYHYHLIDIEVMAMGVFGTPVPEKLEQLHTRFGLIRDNDAPHTALSDAREVRTLFTAMRMLHAAH